MSFGSSVPLKVKVNDSALTPESPVSTVSRIKGLCSFRISTGCTRWEAVIFNPLGAAPPHPARVSTSRKETASLIQIKWANFGNPLPFFILSPPSASSDVGENWTDSTLVAGSAKPFRTFIRS